MCGRCKSVKRGRENHGANFGSLMKTNSYMFYCERNFSNNSCFTSERPLYELSNLLQFGYENFEFFIFFAPL